MKISSHQLGAFPKKDVGRAHITIMGIQVSGYTLSLHVLLFTIVFVGYATNNTLPECLREQKSLSLYKVSCFSVRLACPKTIAHYFIPLFC